jgi:phosphopantothenoylcysteine decarboxylase/phosphopantothenate--cysteine ligase
MSEKENSIFSINKNMVLSGKVIALCVSGGIACYKAADLASRLVKAGAIVRTVMTKNATEFISPLTFEAITSQKVLTDLFSGSGESDNSIGHISLSEAADIFVVAPATAHIIAKIANGICDDALSTTLLAARNRIIVAPAMNNHMWTNQATQDNVARLKERGLIIVGPETGRLACGEEEAIGRLASVDRIFSEIVGEIERTLRERMLSRQALLEHASSESADLAGVKIVVTAGGTREPIDPVRYIGNRSSGKMGYAIAEAAISRGAEVVLITGPSCLEPPAGVNAVGVETALQMHAAVLEHLSSSDVLIMSAAVAAAVTAKKAEMPVRSEKSSDSIQTIIGFAAESENIIPNAFEKLKRKNLDLIIANDISIKGAGFDSDLNYAVMVDRNGPVGELQMHRKTELSEAILDWLVAYRQACG